MGKEDYTFKLKFLRKLYLNGNISIKSKEKILDIMKRPLRSSKGTKLAALGNLELIKFYIRIREYQEALILAQDTSLNHPRAHIQWLAEQWIAFIQGRMGNHDQAIAMYEESLLDGNLGRFFLENYAENLMKNQRYQQAASRYTGQVRYRQTYG